MEAAAEQTIQDPAQVLSELKAAMKSDGKREVGASLAPTQTPIPPETGERDLPESDLFDSPEKRIGGTSSNVLLSSALTEAEAPLARKHAKRILGSDNLPHSPPNVHQWVGTVRPKGDTSLIDLEAEDEIEDKGSLYDPPLPEEERPSDAGSVRSELAMFRVYTERQLEESRKYMEDQMRSTHDLLTRIETRLSLLEKKAAMPSSRPTSVLLPTAPPKPPIQSIVGANTTVAAKQASSSTATFGGINELPPYSPNKTIQVRTLNRVLRDKGLSLQPLSKAISRKDWALQYINSLPTFQY
jgi:hypothetical protein